jgi:hypothetical protein
MIKCYKSIAVALFFACTNLTCTPEATYKSDEQKPTKKQIVIVTNLEDVLIKKDWYSIFSGLSKGFIKSGNKLALTKLMFSLSFLQDCYRAARKELYDHGIHLIHKSDYVSYFARTYPALKNHEAKLFDILNEYWLDEEMVAFYLWLKISKNYNLFVATNKNHASYALIKKKLNGALQTRFGIGWDDLFDGGFYVDKIDKKTGLPFSLYPKPDEHYFLGLWNYLSIQGYTKESTHVMYIDDAEPNILAAQATHHEYDIPLDGVYYQRPEQIKNAITRLCESLEKHASGFLE